MYSMIVYSPLLWRSRATLTTDFWTVGEEKHEQISIQACGLKKKEKENWKGFWCRNIRDNKDSVDYQRGKKTSGEERWRISCMWEDVATVYLLKNGMEEVWRKENQMWVKKKLNKTTQDKSKRQFAWKHVEQRHIHHPRHEHCLPSLCSSRPSRFHFSILFLVSSDLKKTTLLNHVNFWKQCCLLL